MRLHILCFELDHYYLVLLKLNKLKKNFFLFKTEQQTTTESSLLSTDTNELATVNDTLTTDTNELATVNATLTRLDHSQFTTEPLKANFCGTETCACKTMANFTESLKRISSSSSKT